MQRTAGERERTAISGIVIFALAKLLFHVLTNHNYGFHRDELQTLADARHLAWGYVVYPPLTPFLGRIELGLLGTSLTGFRVLAALAQSVVIVLAALIAKRLGGGRAAQWITALFTAIGPVSLAASALFQYVSFDILWWVLIAYGVASLVATGDGRWWLLVGAAIGLGVQTKYTIAFLVAGLAVAVFTTDLRRHLRARWIWIGAAVATVIAAPNLVWQWQHHFESLAFLRHIHERDIRIGRTDHFLLAQLHTSANFVAVPIWAAGFVALTMSKLRRFRALALLVAVPFLLFVVAKGRGYYTAALYPTLIAAGAVAITSAAESWTATRRRFTVAVISLLFVAGSGAALVALPLAPVNSRLWEFASKLNGDFREELGWQELAGEVARIWKSLSPAERQRTTIFCTNYGEAGALDLYGPALGLPRPISGANAFWQRGYGDGRATTVIVLGASREDVEGACRSVTLAGHVTNRYGVANEESSEHPDIFLCRELKFTWAQLWPRTREFG